MIYPVILCGGSGTRLWPLSRRSMPKQFLNLTGKVSLFQQAALRVSGPEFEETLVITANDYRFIAAQQLVDIGIKSSTVLLEPSPKNTAPAVLAAAEKIYQEDPDALMLVVSSDHYIPDRSAFIERVVAAK
ncbi:MAG: mannose-1-phosphate guanylyltransferase/mannose-6-phosphate isomerase, partial [Rhodospirillaceae bacterium]|nr:mannose-1-phosphate guanylyltransferase/mannose-6-phosphate isomerase [Rhodospirillaceae bacterium]